MTLSKNRSFSRLASNVNADGDVVATGIAPSVSLGASVYDSIGELPFTNVNEGQTALIPNTGRFYVYSGQGWYNVAVINRTPTFTSIEDSDGNVSPFNLPIDGSSINITLVAGDSDGDPLTYSYIADSGFDGLATISGSGTEYTVTPFSQDSATTTSGTITFKATDGINIASDINTFTLNFVSAYWDETVLSIGTNSTNGLANSTFIDRSTNAQTVTPTGSPVQTAFHPYLDNWSVEFDGSGYLTLGGGQSFAFGTGDFTIEFWMYADSFSATNSTSPILVEFRSANGAFPLLFIPVGTNGVTYYVNSANRIVATNCLSLHTWHHVALSRSGTSTKLFVDGSQVGSTYTDSTDYSVGTNRPLIGKNGTLSNGEFSGYMSNLKMVKGTALYTSNFTPPTEKLTAVTGTSLLTCQSNRFIDNSTNGHTITVNGNPVISAFNPFGQDSEYAVGLNKGSVVFDGSSDYATLSETPTSLLPETSDTTFECWVRTTSSGDMGIFSNYNSSSPFNGVEFGVNDGYQTFWSQGTWINRPTSTGVSTINDGGWHHLVWVITNSGTTLTTYVDGTQNYTSSITPSTTGNVTQSIGSDSNSPRGRYFNGYIADIRFVKGTALYTSNFTPPTAPVSNTNASLYLPMDNAGVFDKTGNNTLTLNGNVATSTTQTKFADTAMYFDGSGDYIELDNNDVVAGDFTIEFWTNFTDNPQSFPSPRFFVSEGNSAGNVSTNFQITINANSATSTAGTVIVFVQPNTLAESSVIRDGNWHHVAVTRASNSVRLFVDGTQQGSATTLSTALNFVNSHIGVRADLVASTYFDGYLENFQILKGIAKYTANFTPPNRTQGRTYQAES